MKSPKKVKGWAIKRRFLSRQITYNKGTKPIQYCWYTEIFRTRKDAAKRKSWIHEDDRENWKVIQVEIHFSPKGK